MFCASVGPATHRLTQTGQMGLSSLIDALRTRWSNDDLTNDLLLAHDILRRGEEARKVREANAYAPASRHAPELQQGDERLRTGVPARARSRGTSDALSLVPWGLISFDSAMPAVAEEPIVHSLPAGSVRRLARTDDRVHVMTHQDPPRRVWSAPHSLHELMFLQQGSEEATPQSTAMGSAMAAAGATSLPRPSSWSHRLALLAALEPCAA